MNPKVWLLWLGLAAALVAFDWPAIQALRPTDPDDFMRLLEVRDWLGGQSWWDVRQHRMGLPPGADMHWSRLVDLPIAAVLAVAGPTAAMALVPLLELLAAMLLLHRLLRGLGESEGTALAGAGIVLLFPLLLSNFMPMRIDHHGWQAVCALGCAAALQDRRRGPWLAGLVAAVWLTISLEGLVLVLALTGLMGLRWLRGEEPALARFCGAVALGGLLLGLLTRPQAGLLTATADQLSWPHLLAFAAAGAVALAGGKAQAPARLGWLALAGGAGAAAILGGLGTAALDPFHGLDPLVRRLWLEKVGEGLPIWQQDWSTALMLAWTPLLVIAGWRERRGRAGWDELALLALAACALSFGLMRGGVAAQLLAVPFAAVLLAKWFVRAQALGTAPARIGAMLACLALLTPIAASAAGKWLDSRPHGGKPAPALAAGMEGACDIAALDGLPPGRVFAPIDMGPEILVRTQHSVVAGAYHRNVRAIGDAIAAFAGDPARARAIMLAEHADTLALCPAASEIAIYASERPDNLAARLRRGELPPWLAPMRGFQGPLRVYRILR